MGPTGDLQAVEAVDRRCDNVQRWIDAQKDYPEARFTFERGFFYGSLRAPDIVLKSADLGRLLDKLMAREPGTAEPGV